MNTVIAVDKELYEAVLRNSVRVNDLEAENHKLKEINLWHSEKSWNCERENQQLKELLRECKKEMVYLFQFYSTMSRESRNELLTKIDNAIGDK